VVVDIPEGSADKVAHSIKLGATKAGAAPVADAHAHDAHK
jgi:hypothetical protein